MASKMVIPLPSPEELDLMQKTAHEVVSKSLEDTFYHKKYLNMDRWPKEHFRKLTKEPYFTILCHISVGVNKFQIVQTLTLLDENAIKNMWYRVYSEFSQKHGSENHLETVD